MATLPGYRPYSPPTPQRDGLGTAALVLGLFALPLALLVGLGALPALAGLGLGVVAVRRDNGRGRAVIGIVASVLALGLAAVSVVWFLGKAAKCADRDRYPDHAARVACIDHEFPMIRRPAPY